MNHQAKRARLDGTNDIATGSLAEVIDLTDSSKEVIIDLTQDVAVVESDVRRKGSRVRKGRGKRASRRNEKGLCRTLEVFLILRHANKGVKSLVLITANQDP